MAKQLSELSWEKRLLIVSYNQKEDQLLTRAKEFISINKCELEDRNLEIIFYEKFKNKTVNKIDLSIEFSNFLLSLVCDDINSLTKFILPLN